MNLVDSSGWMEYFIHGPRSYFFSESIKDVHRLIVPTICLYEVFKKTLQTFDEKKALEVAAVMQQGQVIILDEQLAFMAAKISVELKLPMADSIILATARQFKATIWTQDTDFEHLPGVKYIQKKY